MNKHEVIKQLIAELDLARGTEWGQPSHRESVFHIFWQSPRDEAGLPALFGDGVKQLVRDELGENSLKFKNIESSLSDACQAWDDWKYALKNWKWKDRNQS